MRYIKLGQALASSHLALDITKLVSFWGIAVSDLCEILQIGDGKAPGMGTFDRNMVIETAVHGERWAYTFFF